MGGGTAVCIAMGCTDEERGAGGAAQSGNGNDQCLQGTFAVDSRADGEGFAHPDGTQVTATLGTSAPQTATTSIRGGRFSVGLSLPSETCNLGASITQPAALYVDVDGDGRCTLAADDVFIWSASGGPWGPHPESNDVTLSPSVEPCGNLFGVDREFVGRVRDALRRLCPEVGDCLPFCRAPDPPMVSLPEVYGGFCAGARYPVEVDAGVATDAGSTGSTNASP